MKVLMIVAIVLALMSMSSCGKNKSNDGEEVGSLGDGKVDVVINGNLNPETPQPLEGRYDAILRPLNTQLNGFIPSGRAKFNVSGETMEVTSYLEDDSRVQHIQNVHVGTRCPTQSDDENGDGLIDIVEMKKVTGDVLIPLDADLSSIAAGADSWPMGKGHTYVKSAKTTDMLNDLYASSRLTTDSSINLAGRVVMVHGTVDLSRVPQSVQTLNGLPRNITVPITCGVIKRL